MADSKNVHLTSFKDNKVLEHLTKPKSCFRNVFEDGTIPPIPMEHGLVEIHDALLSHIPISQLPAEMLVTSLSSFTATHVSPKYHQPMNPSPLKQATSISENLKDMNVVAPPTTTDNIPVLLDAAMADDSRKRKASFTIDGDGESFSVFKNFLPSMLKKKRTEENTEFV